MDLICWNKAFFGLSIMHTFLSLHRHINHEYPLTYVKEDFEEYAQKAKTLPAGTSNDNKLALYGLYKQATVGPVNTGNLYLANGVTL